MPGQEHLAARARVAESVMPDGPEFTRPAGAPAATSSGPDAGNRRAAVPLAGVEDEPARWWPP